ncbi:MAG: tRNA lysidine(34) synthetase TilS [Muribaculaceae bacterium]
MKRDEFQQKVAAAIARDGLLSDDGSKVLVALSGGADSMALLEVLLSLNYEVLAAHCNFHLRGEESNRDEAFVVEHCRNRGIEVLVKHFDVASYEQQYGVSTEMACRELRYAWFEQTMAEHACQAIAVAHHADDVVETFFLNALRGSGVSGLASIKPRNGHIVRPMLDVSRADVEDYLQSICVEYVVDSTNLGTDYRRNQIRNVVLPQIYELLPESRAGLRRTMTDMRAEWCLFDNLITERELAIVKREANGCITIDSNQIASMGLAGESMLFHIVNKYGFNSVQVREILCAMGNSGRRFESDEYVLNVEREGLTLIERRLLPADVEVPFVLSKGVEQPVVVSVEKMSGPFAPASTDGRFKVAFSTKILNARCAVLRHWRTGDRMRPFGLKGTKLLSDLFADAKYSEMEKREAWLLEVDGVIVWVLGLRSADAFRVGACDKEYMCFTYKRL